MTGCHRAVTDPKDPNFIVAENNQWQITRAQLVQEVDAFLQQHQTTRAQVGAEKFPFLETSVLDNMVMRKLLFAQASSLSLKDTDREEAATFEQFKSRFPNQQEFEKQLQASKLTIDELKSRIHEEELIRKAMEMDLASTVDPTEQEISDFYHQHPEYFNVPPKVRISRVLILVDEGMSSEQKAKKKKAIDQARARVAQGEDFAKVAREVSQDKYSAPKGGDIDFIQRGSSEKPFDDMAFSTKVGTVSPVFQTMVGYWFIKVTDTKPAGLVPLAEAHDQIMMYLRRLKKPQQVKAYTDKLSIQEGVTYHIARVYPQASASQRNP